MYLQYLVEEPKYVKSIYSFVDDQEKRLENCVDEFDQNCFFEILKFVIDLDSKLNLDLNFEIKAFVGNKCSTNKALTLGIIIGYLRQIKDITENLVKYQSRPDKYSHLIKDKHKLLVTLLRNIHEECYRIFYLYDIEPDTIKQ